MKHTYEPERGGISVHYYMIHHEAGRWVSYNDDGVHVVHN